MELNLVIIVASRCLIPAYMMWTSPKHSSDLADDGNSIEDVSDLELRSECCVAIGLSHLIKKGHML